MQDAMHKLHKCSPGLAAVCATLQLGMEAALWDSSAGTAAQKVIL